MLGLIGNYFSDNNSIRLLLPISYLYFEFSVKNEWLKLMKLMKYQKPTKNKNASYVCLSPHRKLSERHNSLAHRRLAYDGERLLKAVTLIGIISIKPSNPALKSKCDTIQME
ncbi:uncharacterized protein LOC120354003 isoform X1 [Nilaparvata lugens]|uniref:uncharacterized protein LOC120354003 isoform X1 n=2 Tax=Nilaparvata lugens TaxID=108931 RepID=UPI00193CF3EB|nr:uncharacterized protein LOC120354003 isoform X1 [Nilaparvata lugens]